MYTLAVFYINFSVCEFQYARTLGYLTVFMFCFKYHIVVSTLNGCVLYILHTLRLGRKEFLFCYILI